MLLKKNYTRSYRIFKVQRNRMKMMTAKESTAIHYTSPPIDSIWPNSVTARAFQKDLLTRRLLSILWRRTKWDPDSQRASLTSNSCTPWTTLSWPSQLIPRVDKYQRLLAQSSAALTKTTSKPEKEQNRLPKKRLTNLTIWHFRRSRTRRKLKDS